MNVPKLRALIQRISNIPDHPVTNIDAPLLTPTRYVPVRPWVEVNIQRRREIREIEDMLWWRNRLEATREVKRNVNSKYQVRKKESEKESEKEKLE